MRALTAVGLAVLGGAAIGGAARLVPAEPARATAALFTVFGLMTTLAAAFPAHGPSWRGRLRGAGLVAGVAVLAAWSASAVAGAPSAVGAAAVVGGAAVLACGVASAACALGARAGHVTFAAASIPMTTAALVFVADPFVEWNGSEGAMNRARVVISVSPLASMARDVGVDWQRSRWLYDGPGVGGAGLSVIGQNYPSRPTAPWTWALAATMLGAGAVAAARPRVSTPAVA